MTELSRLSPPSRSLPVVRDVVAARAIATALCWWFFAGFRLGDDAAYSDLAQSLAHGSGHSNVDV